MINVFRRRLGFRVCVIEGDGHMVEDRLIHGSQYRIHKQNGKYFETKWKLH